MEKSVRLSSYSDEDWIFQSQTTTWLGQATTFRGLGGACVSVDSREMAAETGRYKKRNPTKSSGVVQLYSQGRTGVLSKQWLAGKVHVTLFVIAEKKST